MSIRLRKVVLPLATFDLDLSFETTARTTALFGPSGSGKTSVLELIAGLRRPLSGRIDVNGVVVADDDGRYVPARLRRIGYVPQDDALFPHLSVRGNIEYGARESNPAVIEILEIGPMLERGVKDLSGGERKRVALARALLASPEVLLLDEPLTGVDAALRNRVLDYLVKVRDSFAIPTLYVTHQMEEVSALCEEIVEIERGKVVRIQKGPELSAPAL